MKKNIDYQFKVCKNVCIQTTVTYTSQLKHTFSLLFGTEMTFCKITILSKFRQSHTVVYIQTELFTTIVCIMRFSNLSKHWDSLYLLREYYLQMSTFRCIFFHNVNRQFLIIWKHQLKLLILKYMLYLHFVLLFPIT